MIKRWQLVLLFFVGVVFAQNTEAASLYIDPPSSTLNRSDSITLAVRIDTDEEAGECINAVDAVIEYTEAIIPADVSIGNSIFSLWVERPTINTVDKTITFAGGLPNGYCGRIQGDPRLSNIIAEIVVRSPGLRIGGGGDVESATLEFSPQTSVLLNDGFGTRVTPQTFGASINLNPNAGSGVVDEWQERVGEDDTPPEEFSIELIMIEGKYHVVFNTTDKQSGLAFYEVIEEPLSDRYLFGWGAADAPWEKRESPYVLKDQSLNSIVRVRAVDKAGNEYVATLQPDSSLSTLPSETIMLFTLIGSLVVVLIVVLLVVWVKVTAVLRKRRSLEEEAEEDNAND
jgi:hypothetical protein